MSLYLGQMGADSATPNGTCLCEPVPTACVTLPAAHSLFTNLEQQRSRQTPSRTPVRGSPRERPVDIAREARANSARYTPTATAGKYDHSIILSSALSAVLTVSGCQVSPRKWRDVLCRT